MDPADHRGLDRLGPERPGGFVGWIAFLGFAPVLFTGPLFGVLADRVPLIRAAFATQFALATLAMVMAVLFGLGRLSAPVLSVLALAIGVATSAHHPVRMSLAPLLVPRGAISSVVTATSLNFNLARSVGPAVGGALIAGFGVGVTLWIITLSFLPYLALLHWLRPRARALSDTAATSILGGLAQGLGMVRRDAYIRRILALTALFALCGRGVLELLPAIADGVFDRGAAGLGTLTSAAGLGALAASLGMVVLPGATPGMVPRWGLVSVWVGLALGMVLALAATWPLALATAAALGACSAGVGVSMQSSLQLVLEDGYRGRVMSLWVMTGIGSAALGALSIGALADLVGLGPGCALVYGAGLALFLAGRRRGL